MFNQKKKLPVKIGFVSVIPKQIYNEMLPSEWLFKEKICEINIEDIAVIQSTQWGETWGIGIYLRNCSWHFTNKPIRFIYE